MSKVIALLKTKLPYCNQNTEKAGEKTKDAVGWTPGYAWKNGKHYTFDKTQITVTQGWPGLRVWVRSHDGVWKGSRFTGIDRSLCDTEYLEETVVGLQRKLDRLVNTNPKPLTLQEFAQLKSEHALLELQKTIPADVLARMRRFWCRRWHLLCFQARVPGAADLIDSNPALGWMLANHWVFRNGVGKDDATRVARRWVGRPQREILQWLGFDSSRSTRRIIARIDPYIADASRLLYLRAGLQDIEVKRAIQHLQHFTADTLRIATDPVLVRRVTPNFLHEISENDVRCSSTHIASQLKTALFHESEYRQKIPKRFHSIAQLERLRLLDPPSDPLHQQLYPSDCIPKMPFPSAPWLGVLGIEPLADYAALQEEGEDMQHCVVSYAASVLQGHCYIYKVTSPLRATLEARYVNGNWILGEVSGRKNATIETNRAIFLWRKLTKQVQSSHIEPKA